MLSVKNKAAILTSLCLGLLLSTVFLNGYLLGYTDLDDKVVYFTLIGSILSLFLMVRLFKDGISLNIIDFSLISYGIYLLANAQRNGGCYNNYLLATVISMLFYVVVKQHLVNKHHTKVADYLAFLYLLISLSEVGLSVYQLYRVVVIGEENVLLVGTFNNTNILAIYVGISFVYFLHWYILLYNRPGANKLFLRLIEVLLLFDIVLLPSTQSRTGLAAVLSISVFILASNNRWIKSRKRVYKITLVCVAVLSVLFISIVSYSYKKESADGRIVIWKTAALMIKDKPLMGTGFNQFQYRFPEYQARYFQANRDDGERFADKDDYAFNDLIQITTEEGLIGLLLILLIIISLIAAYHKERSKSISLRVSMSGLAFIFLSSFFSYPLEVMPIWCLLVIFLLTVSSGLLNLHPIKLNKTAVPVFLMLGVGFCGWAVIYECDALHAKKNIFNARESFLDENYQAATDFYGKALKFMPSEKAILLEMGKSYLLSNQNSSCIKLLATAEKSISDPFLYSNMGEAYSNLGNYQKSERCFLHAIALMPNRMYPRYLLAKLYIKSHQIKKAKLLANEINSMPIKIESSATAEMKTEINELIKKF
jgi:O-antigen ligase